MTLRCIAYALAASLLAAPGATLAQSAWPSKTVRIVVPVEPSAPEEFGRFLQSEMNRWKGLVKKP
jgi:tripartite-type tricarboxylate transporter receptor subunit TctC